MKNNLWAVINLAWELGYLIALPIAILGLGGAWLDKKMATSPLFLLLGIIFSIVISSVAIYRKIKMLKITR